MAASESHLSLPVVSLGIVAAAVGLYFVLRKPGAAPASRVSATAPPVAQPIASLPPEVRSSSSSSSVRAQDSQDQAIVEAVLQQLQDQGAPAVQQAIADADVPPEVRAIVSSLPASLPPIPKGFGF